MITIHYWP